MKPRIETLSLALASTLPISLAGIGHAASVTYDADLITTSAQDGAGAGWNADLGNTSFWNGTTNVVWPNTTADEIIFGAGSGAAGDVTVGTVNANKITFGAPGSGNYSLTGGTVTLGGTTPTIAVNSDASIASTLTGTAGLNINGTGALTLTGPQTYNNALTFTNKSVTFSGSSASTATTNAILIGGATGRTAVNFNSSGNFTYGTTAGNTRIGGNDGAGDTGAAAVTQTNGNVTFARNGSYLEFGTNTGATATSYGSYLLTGGAFTTTVNGGARIGNGGLGVFTQTGGTANIGRWLAIGASTGAAAASKGVVTLTGGSLTVNSGYRALLGERQNASGTLNIGTQAGGDATMTSANGTGVVLLSTASAASATVNLNSGTLTLGGSINRNGTTAGSLATVNLNGGTLRPSVNNLNLISNANGLSANVYNGGLKVDTQALDATINANLVTTTGNGIYPAGGVLNLPVAAGDGYIGAPVVTVSTSGTGTGATAVANIASGQVTGVTLTSPGQGFLAGDTVTFTFAGGGAGTAATPFAYTLTEGDLASNGTGGLTKLGTGKLTLSGINTFNGPVSVTGSLVSNILSLNNAALSIHNFAPTANSAPVQVNTTLTTGGTVQVQVDGTFSQGVWPLIYYPLGGLGGSGFASFQLQTGTLPRGVIATLQDNPANSVIELNVSGFNPLTWRGNTNAVWDINSTVNWRIGATPEKYLNGDLVVFNDAATGSTNVTLNTTVTPQGVSFENDTKAYTLSGTGSIAGTGGVTKSSNGSVTILNANTYTGSTTVNGGTLQLGNGTVNGSIASTLVNYATVIFHPAGTATHSGGLSGDNLGTFIKDGNGTQILTNASNTSTGTFQVNAGTLQFGDGSTNGAIGGMLYQLAAGTTLKLQQATAAALPANSIIGSGDIVLNSAQGANGSAGWGTLALPPEYTGVLRVENGRVEALDGKSATGGASKVQILSGAQFLAFASAEPYTTPIEIAGTGWGEGGYPCALRLAADRTATWAGAVTLTADSGIMAQRNTNFTITGPITGAYQCEFYSGDPVAENGNLIVAPIVPGQNTYASTKINGRPSASVTAGSDQAFSTGPLVVDNAILKLNGHNLSFSSLAGAGGAIGNYHATTPVTLTVGSGNADSSYAGVLRDGGATPLALTKTGTGTQTLTAVQTYTGNTTIAQGKLVLANSAIADASTVTINSGAVLELTAATSDTIGALVLGGTSVGSGTYNATHPTYGAYFAGSGSLVVGGAYDSWAASKGLDGTPGKENGLADDPDKDGIPNLTEFYLDGNPLANDPSILPAGSLDANYLTLTFHRRDDAESSVTTQAVQYGTSLGSWTDVAIGAANSTGPNGVIATVTENDAATDLITVQIPRTLAASGKLFGRLQVVK